MIRIHNFINLIKRPLIFAMCILIVGCDLEVENLNEPDRDAVLSSQEEVIALLKSSHISYYNSLISSRNVYYGYLGDQFSSCSLSAPWPYNREPRERLTNESSGTFESRMYFDWKASYKAIVVANDVLAQAENWTEDADQTVEQTRAAAAALKGVSMGFVGLFYREGIILDTNIAKEEMAFASYNDIIEKAIVYIEEAKAIYTANPDFNWDYVTGMSLSSDEIIKVLNTYAAKFLVGSARTHDEFNALDFDRISSYLDQSIESKFTVAGTAELYNAYQYYAARERSNGKSSYGCDQKIPWLLSGKTAPTKKGTEDTELITSADKRFELYFEYKEQSLLYYSERDPTLYSNYVTSRYREDTRYVSETNFLLLEEVLLLKAEVAYGQGNYQLAADILNGSRRVTVGELPLLNADPQELADALFYENCIELVVAGKGISYMFMRRWNLLQEGTILHYAVPGTEAELLGYEALTIGGAGTGDGIDSATGNTSWR